MTSRSRHRRPPKTIPVQGITGQRGVNLIERLVLDMGSRWTASGPNEVGIDGYIELFDPNSHLPLGLTLAVQSKVVTALAENPKPTFDYWCDANDIDYWFNGNTPVILVVSSPSTREAFWISITNYFKDWVPNGSTRVIFNRSQDQFNTDSFRQLVKIAAPKSGLYLAPARKTETLHSNLLPLESWPPRIFIAETECRTRGGVWALLRSSEREIDTAWVLWEGKIFSFHELDEPHGPPSAIRERWKLLQPLIGREPMTLNFDAYLYKS